MRKNIIKTLLQCRMVIIAVMLGIATSATAGDQFYLPDFSINAGESKEVVIQFESDNVSTADPSQLEYVGFQFDLLLPEGLTVAKVKNKYSFSFNPARIDDHTFTSTDYSKGTIRVLSASLSNAYLWETKGNFIKFTVVASADIKGTQNITMRNIYFSTKAGVRTQLPDVVTTVVVADVKEEVITFADSKVKELCVSNWDTNGDGELSYTEASAVTSLGMVFSKTEIASFNELEYFTGLKSIYMMAFQDCKNLASVIIPDCVDTIDFFAFTNCSSLNSIRIPKNVTKIASSAFRNCGGLESITVNPGNTKYDSRDNCNAIVETLTNQLFLGCKTTVIPDNVSIIGAHAFYGCSGLTSITIPSSVTEIRSGAFVGCSLASVTSMAQTPPVLATGLEFSDCIIADAVLYVPKGSKSSYESTAGWDCFANIVELGGDEPEPEPEPDDDTDISAIDNVLYVKNSDGFAGTSVTLSLNLKHTMDVSAFQANLYLPEGFEIEKITRGSALKEKNDYEEYIYVFNNSPSEDGSRFLLCYSLDNVPMSTGDIDIANIKVKIPEGISEGEYPVILKNVEISYGSEKVIVEYVKSTLTVNDYIPGDANGDGRLSVTDISSIASYLLGTTPSGFVEKAADVNDDNRVSVTDISSIAAKLLNGSSNAKTVFVEFD